MTATVETVNVFDHDPDLLRGVDGAGAAAAGERSRVGVVVCRPGRTSLGHAARGGFGLLVLEGFLCREASVAARASVELLGTGDVLRPWDDSRAEAPVPVDSQHLALSDVRFAVLDRDFAEAVGRWPEVSDVICARLVDRARWLALQLAISRVRRIEDRVLVLLWHLADRWGRVQPDGTIVCPVPLTHQLVAGMISAQRPTVSTSFARLASEGRIAKHPEGWTLCGAAPTLGEVEGRALADAFRVRRED